MANEDAGRNRRVAATEDEGRARAAGARKPGVVANMMERCRESVQSIRLPRPDWRTFAWGLLLLIMVILIVRNWAPVRINLFGWYLDAPKAVVFAIVFALGMVTTWLLEMRHRRARPARRADAAVDVDKELSTPVVYEDEVAEADEDLIDEDEPVAAEDEPEPDVDEDDAPAPSVSEAFAPLPEDEEAEDEAIVVPQDFAPDAAGDEISFDEPEDKPEDDPEALRSLDEDVDADLELEDVLGDSGEEAADEDDAKPFWRS